MRITLDTEHMTATMAEEMANVITRAIEARRKADRMNGHVLPESWMIALHALNDRRVAATPR